MKDKRGKGLEDRLVKMWPAQFDSASKLRRILEDVEMPEMKENNINGLSIIFKKISQSNLIFDIFKGSIHSSDQILNVD